MSESESALLPQLVAKHESEILKSWIAAQLAQRGTARGGVREEDLRAQSREFLSAFRDAVQRDGTGEIDGPSWTPVRETLSDIGTQQAKQGASASEVATFIFSLKQILFELLQRETIKTPELFARGIWSVTLLLDRLGLFTIQLAMKLREEVIARQQTEMLELSTPVVKLWEGVLALPLIGTLDSERTQVVMESLLQEIVRTGAGIAIIDITGVPTVDTLVAQHLLKTVAAARLMGAQCIISGIRPQIASTIVHLGVDLGDVTTKATLADAFAIALKRNHLTVTRIAGAPKQAT
ncbi:MAG: STAS domain-containing protein [Terriglobia bacterium]